jgi:hypothetical protein
MEWIGYTTHHLWGNITILLVIVLMWLFNKMSINDSKKTIWIMIIIFIVFIVCYLYTLYLADNPNEVIKLF